MIETIVVGSDGSDTAAVAVRHAAELAKSLGARLHVVSAYRPLSGVRVAGADADPERADWAVSATVNVDAVLDGVAGAARAIGRRGGLLRAQGGPGRGDPRRRRGAGAPT